MDPVSARVDALVADARRAAAPGGLGDDPDRPGSLLTSPSDSSRRAAIPNASPLSIAIDGAGLFVLAAPDGSRLYSRLGDFRVERGVLTDGRGRAVLGSSGAAQTSTGAASGRLAPLAVGACTDVTIAGDGTVSGTNGGRRRIIGRVMLALFAAPERLERDTDTTVRASAAAGSPWIVAPAQSNVGTLRDHELENSTVALEADLIHAWRLSQQGDAQAASAHADDECQRDALELVR